MRHAMPDRERSAFSATEVKAGYDEAYPSAIEEVAIEYGSKVTVVRKVAGKGKYSTAPKETAVFTFMANIIFNDADVGREAKPDTTYSAVVYAPYSALKRAAAANPAHEIRSSDTFIIDGTHYRIDSINLHGTFRGVKGQAQFTVTTVA